MPYIKQERREALQAGLVEAKDLSAGDLNFLITGLLKMFLLSKPPSYENLNAAVGALECAKIELYRRIAAPYEDFKIATNGDVWQDDSEKNRVAVPDTKIVLPS